MMSYGPQDIRHLSIMADIANATPQETKQLSIADLIASDVIVEPTIDVKIATLCAKLSAGGFERYADSLGQKLINYKLAATHMYRAIDEDGDDVINFAHPDGEVDMVDASGDLGTFETLLTKHRKHVEVVNKVPTGKLASYLERVKLALTKQADEFNSIPTKVEEDSSDNTLHNETTQNDSKNTKLTTYQLDLTTKCISLIEELITNHGPKLTDWARHDKTTKPGYGWTDLLSVIPGASGMSSAVENIDTYKTSLGHLEWIKSNLKELQLAPPGAETNEKIKKDLESFIAIVNHAEKMPAERKPYYIKKAQWYIGQVDVALHKAEGMEVKPKDGTTNTSITTLPTATNSSSKTQLAGLKQDGITKLQAFYVSIDSRKLTPTVKENAKQWTKNQISEITLCNKLDQLNVLLAQITKGEEQLKSLEIK